MVEYFQQVLMYGIASGIVVGFFCYFWGYAIKKLLSYFM